MHRMVHLIGVAPDSCIESRRVSSGVYLSSSSNFIQPINPTEVVVNDS